jgi:hypothetical protein
MEIYFVFFFPPQIKMETQPTLHTLSKPHEPTLKPKLCQRVQSCLHTEGIGRNLMQTDMKEYINQIFRFLLLIVQKKENEIYINLTTQRLILRQLQLRLKARELVVNQFQIYMRLLKPLKKIISLIQY